MSKKVKLSKAQARIASEFVAREMDGHAGGSEKELKALAKKLAKAIVAGFRVTSKASR